MIVATTGKFDVMHYGHFRILHYIATYAIETKSIMLIMIDSDDRIKKMTGQLPVFTQIERSEQVKEVLKGISPPPALLFQTYVFDSDEELADAYRTYQQQQEKIVLIKGSEWKNQPIIGKEFVDVYYVDSGDRKMSSSYIKERIKEWWNEANQRPI